MQRSEASGFCASPLRWTLVAALAAAATAPAHAQVQYFVSIGANSTSPVNLLPIPPGASIFDYTGNTLFIGNSISGSFTAQSGALLRGDGLVLGTGQTGIGSAFIQGAGTQALFGGTGSRLEVGSWGFASLDVGGGALIDATGNTAGCAANSCRSFVGNGAGSSADLAIRNAGTEVRLIRTFDVGQASVFTQAVDGFNFGTPGGTTNATVSVLNGGTLRTQTARIGSGPNTAAALGTERGIGNVLISGAGSSWIATPNSIDGGPATFIVGNRVGGQGTVTVNSGGRLLLDGTGGSNQVFDQITIGANGGQGSMTVSGVGSSVEARGANPNIQIGRTGAASTGSFSVLAGATASSLFINVGGGTGGNGTLTVNGAGSRLNLVGTGTPGLLDSGSGFMSIGRETGTGVATVSNGGSVFISDGGGDSRAVLGSTGIQVGANAGSVGTLNITGPGSTVQITSTSLAPAAGVADNRNPFAAFGRFTGSTGELQVSNGGKLLMQGNAISTSENQRGTVLNIGGADDTVAGGTGRATVTGQGSEIRVTGSDAFIAVGRGPGGVGELNILDQGSVSAGVVSIGRGAGSTGSLFLNGGSLNLSGQFTGPTQSGAVLTVGNAGGTGIATVANGSRVDLTNLGSAGAAVTVGGSGQYPLGNGQLTVVNGSQINLTAASGLATFTVGRDGTGNATVAGQSSINVGDGSTYIGRLAGGVGNMTLSGGSTLTSGYVGIGSNQSGDGGTGSLFVNNSTVNAGTLEIGTNGFLGGNNGTINGNVILHGTLNPGESPGRIIVSGGIRSASGHLILEVQDNGEGGFAIDQLILTRGSTFSFPGLEVTFDFLGETNPTSFLESGLFDLDNFLLSLDTETGRLSGLSSEFAPGQTYETLFANATINAESDFYDLSGVRIAADGSATFTAAPIPEPETWAMMIAGLALLTRFGVKRAARVRAG